MQFPSGEAIARWRQATYSHASFKDWVGWLRNGTREVLAVDKQLAVMAKRHAPQRYDFLLLEAKDTGLELMFETGEDDFRAIAGDVAALLRSAAAHGASGTFLFLGTAGAEHDFVYQLSLGGGSSKIANLRRDEITAVYEGEAYRLHMDRLMELVTQNDPVVKDLLASPGPQPVLRGYQPRPKAKAKPKPRAKPKTATPRTRRRS